jgi:hypothetical protein
VVTPRVLESLLRVALICRKEAVYRRSFRLTSLPGSPPIEYRQPASSAAL